MNLYNSKIDVYRTDKISDGMGSWYTTENLVYENLPCRINWVKGAEKIQFDKNTYYRDGKVYCRPVEITTDYCIKYNGVTYDVVNVSNVDNMNRLLVLEIKLRQSDGT